MRDVGTRELAQRYGIVDLDEDGRVLDFVEKPDDPPSTLAATATYLYHRAHVPLVRTYLDGGQSLRTSPAGSSAGCTGASPSTAGRSTPAGTTSATTSSCWRRTTASAREQGLPERAAYSPE